MHSVDQGLNEDRLHEQRAYWRHALAGASWLVELPTDRPRNQRPAAATSIASFDFALDAVLTSGLMALARRHDVTLRVAWLAAWGALLGRLSGQIDVVIGTFADTEAFASEPRKLLPLRLNSAGSLSVAQWLRFVQSQTQAALQHQALSLVEVAELARVPHSRRPLLQLVFAWGELPTGLQSSEAAGGAELSLQAHERRLHRSGSPVPDRLVRPRQHSAPCRVPAVHHDGNGG